jgi:hypothetical protein
MTVGKEVPKTKKKAAKAPAMRPWRMSRALQGSPR